VTSTVDVLSAFSFYTKFYCICFAEYTVDAQPQVEENSFSPHKRGFDFSSNTNATAFAAADGVGFSFGSSVPLNKDTPPLGSAASSNTNPFVFGAFGQESKCKNLTAVLKFSVT
jgi:hypothetical protein